MARGSRGPGGKPLTHRYWHSAKFGRAGLLSLLGAAVVLTLTLRGRAALDTYTSTLRGLLNGL